MFQKTAIILPKHSRGQQNLKEKLHCLAQERKEQIPLPLIAFSYVLYVKLKTTRVQLLSTL